MNHTNKQNVFIPSSVLAFFLPRTAVGSSPSNTANLLAMVVAACAHIECTCNTLAQTTFDPKQTANHLKRGKGAKNSTLTAFSPARKLQSQQQTAHT